MMQSRYDGAACLDTQERKNGVYQAGTTADGEASKESQGVAHMLEIAFVGVFEVLVQVQVVGHLTNLHKVSWNDFIIVLAVRNSVPNNANKVYNIRTKN